MLTLNFISGHVVILGTLVSDQEEIEPTVDYILLTPGLYNAVVFGV